MHEQLLPAFVDPDGRFASSYAEALREGVFEHPTDEEQLQRIEFRFAEWWARRIDLRVPATLPDGSKVPKVPQVTRWLVGDGQYLGEVSVRHELSESLRTYGGHIGYALRARERRKGFGHRLLHEGLRVARTLNHDRVLITCDDENVPSIAVIEGAGGVLEDKIPSRFRSSMTRRYWIDLLR